MSETLSAAGGQMDLNVFGQQFPGFKKQQLEGYFVIQDATQPADLLGTSRRDWMICLQ